LIVVDSSVWIDTYRRPQGRNAEVLRTLLAADEVALPWPVRFELSSGVSKRDRPALLRGLSALPLLYASDETWALLDTWLPAAGDRGRRFTLPDWLIAAMACEIGGLVWSLDDDFAEMERLKFVRCYEVP
jgi:predicted nucleic acid-binding protein